MEGREWALNTLRWNQTTPGSRAPPPSPEPHNPWSHAARAPEARHVRSLAPVEERSETEMEPRGAQSQLVKLDRF